MQGSKLDAALALAARGFKVFPLRENGKLPAIKDFTTLATSEAAIIREWWASSLTGITKEYNVGVLTTDMVVADVDVKMGKPGLEEYLALGGHFDTLTVRTPTGGYHCYFVGPDSSLAPLGKGLDIRSHNGFVVGPGSTIDGTPYEVLYDLPIAYVPLPIELKLRRPGTRADRERQGVEFDTPNAIDIARLWLERDAPVAVEGAGGDLTTYSVAAQLLRDYALTEETAFELMIELWNDKCVPSWDAGELWGKVENAYNYGTGDLGAKLPSVLFNAVEFVDVKAANEPEPNVVRFGNVVPIETLPPRNWLVEGLLMKKAITLLPAAGAAGKSLLTLTIAAHLAVGKPLGKYTPRYACKSIIYNAEDDIPEQTRRLFAICVEYKLDYQEVTRNIMLLSSDVFDLRLASSMGRQIVQNTAHVDWLKQAASAPDVGMLVLDPLIELHTCDESDPAQMKDLMTILRGIIREADVALLLPHHTSKSSGTAGAPRAGNIDAARGTGAIANACRIAVTLFPATDQDREQFGISEEDRNLYVRLDDAKMNLTLASAKASWFKRTTISLFNGDDVGALKWHDMQVNEDTQKQYVASVMLEVMLRENVGAISLKKAAGELQSADPLYERMGEMSVRNKIERYLRSPIVLEGGIVSCQRRSENGVDRVQVVLE